MGGTVRRPKTPGNKFGQDDDFEDIEEETKSKHSAKNSATSINEMLA
jgi:hypothetical protein